jgi:hypothetical protein
MSARSIRRAQARLAARDHRRAFLRRRRELAAGTLGAMALLGSSAQAAGIQVSNTNDSGAGSLRDAITQANSVAGPDDITFAPGVNGLIRLTTGALPISASEGLTITGPGRDVLTVSGDANSSGTPNAGDSRVFNITASSAAQIAISGLTLTRGYDPGGGSGGAINNSGGAELTLTGDAITNSKSDQTGGGLFLTGDFTIAGSTISGNTAMNGGGVSHGSGGPTSAAGTISDSTISDNHATGSPSSAGGGIFATGDSLILERSTLSGNTATGAGGGVLSSPKYGLTVDNAVVSGNSAGSGGGMEIGAGGSKYSPVKITETTVSGNQAGHGAGIHLLGISEGNKATIARSTISGNDGGAGSWGGGILIDYSISGAVDLVDSTVSGNAATAGGGVSLGSDANNPLLATYSGDRTGTIDFDNSTIAGNTASAHGGGIYLSQYDGGTPTVKQSGSAGITSTVVADNAGGDLDRVDTSTSGGFAGAFSLVEAPGDAPLTQEATIVGTDPQLGALGDHGGPTATMLPAGTSPLLDKGRSPSKLKVDQRNAARLVDTALPNPASGGDGTDIGAVELAADAVVIPPPPPPPPKATFGVSVGGKSIASGAPLLPASATPLNCAVTAVTMTSCNIEIRSASKTRLSKKSSIPKGALLAEGTGRSASGATQLSLKVKLTRDGKAVLKARPLGVDAPVAATASTDATSALTTAGKVHLLAGRSVTLVLGRRSPRLSKAVVKQLDQLAKLIPGAKTVSCTAYSDKGKGDVALTKKQAKAACARLVKRGVKGKVTSTGKGHAKPAASNRTGRGRKANRRVVVKFTL